MSIPYNPFELLNLPMLKDLQRRRIYFLVVQRLNWPGIPIGKGFITTPYLTKPPAQIHAQKLTTNEGRLIDLQSETDTILGLIESTKFLLFLNSYRDSDWESKVLKHYQKNIALNLKTLTRIQVLEPLNVELSYQDGELKAIIQTHESVIEFSLDKLIK